MINQFYKLLSIFFVVLGTGLMLGNQGQYSTTLAAVNPCVSPSPSPTASVTPTPTATPTSSPTPTPTPTPHAQPTELVFLTEFMACPSSGNEWLELFNGSDQTITVTNWQVLDGSNNKKLISGSILPHSYSVFEWSGSMLNNTGDSFTVYSDTNKEIGSASYENCVSGISYVYENGEWVGAINSPNEETTISENTVNTSSATATLRKSTSETPAPPKNNYLSLLPLTATENSQQLEPAFPFQLPTALELLKNSTTPESQRPTPPAPPQQTSASAISVIIGGLLQLITSGWYLYDSYFSKHA